jgi:hypothetical protein
MTEFDEGIAWEAAIWAEAQRQMLERCIGVVRHYSSSTSEMSNRLGQVEWAQQHIKLCDLLISLMERLAPHPSKERAKDER